jgi:hypothetical protein
MYYILQYVVSPLHYNHCQGVDALPAPCVLGTPPPAHPAHPLSMNARLCRSQRPGAAAVEQHMSLSV